MNTIPGRQKVVDVNLEHVSKRNQFVICDGSLVLFDFGNEITGHVKPLKLGSDGQFLLGQPLGVSRLPNIRPSQISFNITRNCHPASLMDSGSKNRDISIPSFPCQYLDKSIETTTLIKTKRNTNEVGITLASGVQSGYRSVNAAVSAPAIFTFGLGNRRALQFEETVLQLDTRLHVLVRGERGHGLPPIAGLFAYVSMSP
jgi:hypothetical protein